MPSLRDLDTIRRAAEAVAATGAGWSGLAKNDVPALCAEIERLRKTLGFYADPQSWREVREQDSLDVVAIDSSDEEVFPPEYDSIGGRRAREALGIPMKHTCDEHENQSVCIASSMGCMHKCSCCQRARAALATSDVAAGKEK